MSDSRYYCCKRPLSRMDHVGLRTPIGESTPGHEGSRRTLKIASVFGPMVRPKKRDLDVCGHYKASDTTRVVRGSRPREDIPDVPTSTVTADVREMNKKYSRHCVSNSLFSSPVMGNYKEHISTLISIYGGAPPRVKSHCKAISTDGRVQYHSKACPSYSQERRENDPAVAATKMWVRQNGASRKVSIPPAFLQQKSPSPPHFPARPGIGENSLSRLEGRLGAVNTMIPPEEEISHRPLEKLSVHAHTLTRKGFPAEPFRSIYDNGHSSATRISKTNENSASNFHKMCIKDGTSELRDQQLAFQRASRAHRLPAKSLKDRNQEAITDVEDKSDQSIAYSTARAVFLGECGSFTEANRQKVKCDRCSISAESNRMINSTKFAESTIYTAPSSNRIDPEQIPEWGYHYSSPRIVKRNWLIQVGYPKIPGKSFLPNNSLHRGVDLKTSPQMTHQARSQVSITKSCSNRSSLCEPSGKSIQPPGPLMPTVVVNQSPESEDISSRRCIVVPGDPTTLSTSEKPISIAKLPRKASFRQTVPKNQETPRVNGIASNSLPRVSSVVANVEFGQGEHKVGYPCVADISKRYKEACLSGQCSQPRTKSRHRSQDSQISSGAALPTENRRSFFRPEGALGREGTHGFRQPQDGKANGEGDYNFRKVAVSEEEVQQHHERSEGMRNSTPSVPTRKFTADNGTDSAVTIQASNVVGWVSRVVGYFEKITTNEQSSCCEALPTESRKLDPGVAEEGMRGVNSLGPGLRGEYSISCLGEETKRLEPDPRRFTSLLWDRPNLLLNDLEDSQRRRKPIRIFQRSNSLTGRESRRHGELSGSRGCRSITRSASAASDAKYNMTATDVGRHTDKPDHAPNNWVSRLQASSKRENAMTTDWEYQEETYLRKKLQSYSSDDGQDLSSTSSPENDYKFFRRAVYGSIFASEDGYAFPDTSLQTKGPDSEDGCELSSLSYSSSVSGDVSAGTTNGSEYKSNSSNEHLDYDSGVVEDNEEFDSLCKGTQPPQPCLRITEIVDNDENITLWRHIPEIANSDFFRRLSSNQLKLQETKFEVMTSETSYMKCLCILISHFYGSDILNDEEVICKEDKEILFSNIVEVRNCSERFLSDLKCCWQDDISLQDLDEVIYKHAEETFGTYITYCFNQVHQLNILNRLMKSEVFVKAIDKLEEHPVCRRRTLQCYLIMPMQRVTRIRLLVDAIHARLPRDNQKYQGWKLASDTLNRVVLQCNDAAKQAAQREEARSLCRRLDFSAFKHADVDLGERFLVHQGDVLHIYSSSDASSNHLGFLSPAANRKKIRQPFTFGRKLQKQPLSLFLFRDLLLITKKKSDGIFMVLVYCPTSDVEIIGGDSCSLQEIPQKNFLEDWKNIFHLFMRKSCGKDFIEMILCAENEYEKDLWLEAFSAKFPLVDT